MLVKIDRISVQREDFSSVQFPLDEGTLADPRVGERSFRVFHLDTGGASPLAAKINLCVAEVYVTGIISIFFLTDTRNDLSH